MPEWHSIQFVWPGLLWMQLLLPLCLGFYIAWQRPRTRSTWPMPQTTAAFSSGRLAQHGPVWLVLAGLSVLLLAVARPQALILLPSRIDTVMLVIDTSGSMRAADVSPSRIEAAQSAAKGLVLGQAGQVKLGVVSVAGAAALVQAPTDERDRVLQAIDGLSLQPGSALGSGVLIALHAMLPGSGLDVQSLMQNEGRPASGAPLNSPASGAAGSAGAAGPAGAAGAAGAATSPPAKGLSLPKVPPGSNTAAAIVLFTDGQGNVGPDALKMAQLAADLGVRIHTVGVGTVQGTVLKAQGMQMRVQLDEGSLQKIAETTRGTYYGLHDAVSLTKIYDTLSRQMVLKKHRLTEVSALFAALGMLLLTGGCAWRWWRHGRIV